MTLGLGLTGAVLDAAPAGAALLCRRVEGHSICIERIQRSAKNFWEYRAIVTVDDEQRPLEVYNCRDRTRTTTNGTVVPFEPNGVGQLICRVLDR